MKKPVRKRKGYQAGGSIDQLNETYARSDKGHEATDRYVAAVNAVTSAAHNEASPGARRLFESWLPGGKLHSERTPDLGRADYPGFKKGGKVKKPASRRSGK